MLSFLGKDYSDLSIQFAGSCVLTRKAVDGKVSTLLTYLLNTCLNM